ncbi:DEAD/DEAH box helicase family protein [Bacillus sp. DJP31]|uniref:DEAD/DEAH box helicase family protein n=1 Tax=Bacillus sp. DJP31 TaxID=3409789 RepID=UPI003BB58F7D
MKLVLPQLKAASARGCEIKMLVGDYLYITQPDALELLLRELPGIELRLFRSAGQSFHPKAYLFRGNDKNHVIVGSSNLSKSALTGGIEWSLHVPTPLEESLFDVAAEEFMKQFYEERTIPLNEETLALYREQFDIHNIQRPFSQAWSEQEEQEVMYGTSVDQPVVVETKEPYIVQEELLPRPAQVLALQALKDSIKDDYDKALAVMATGLGKTYLAAFFAEDFKRVLFVAHREEILIQAQHSFKHVHPDTSTGFYNAKDQKLDSNFVFASVQTLNQQHHLSRFKPDTFDLIVVDEFHHASAPSYMRILEYFKPRFLLGITATPYRLDNKDVFGLCDGNVAISIHFLDAIKNQWLAPFRYHGIYDDTDYSQIRWLGTRYDEEELARVQLRTEMAEKILQEWIDHKQSRTIAFCSSIRQADFLNRHFQQAGFRSISLNGNTPNEERLAARDQLNTGKLDIIFTVDLFNEGVDIPRVDTLLFVRPTESLAVFTQQIGRGLRITDGKDHCVIIDLIGNYRNADIKWGVFNPTYVGVPEPRLIEQSMPEGCQFNIDTEVIDRLCRFVCSKK